jgi:hypothetical protein
LSNLFSKLADSLRWRFGGDRRVAPRYHLEERLTVSVARPNVGTRPSNVPTALYGYTRDVSESGLAFVLPDLKVGGYHFALAGRVMRIHLKLPSGPIEMEVAYARHAELEGEAGYLVGVQITKMNGKARARYQNFIKTLAG